MQKKEFGKTQDGLTVYLYTLTNKNGMRAEIINYGGIITSLYVPDQHGNLEDVVLGFDDLQGYEKNNPYFGALIGRCANRIEDARFELNGRAYNLLKNNGNNHLHGGAKGFDKVVWDVQSADSSSIKLFYRSVDGEEGYPGNLNVTVTYTLTDDNAITIDYHAETDADTVINLTNHSYFNLSGHASGDITSHQVKIKADEFTVSDDTCTATGEILSVTGTPLDLRDFRTLELGLMSDNEHIKAGNGYDHNFVLNVSGKKPEYCAEVYDPKSGRRMEVYTTKPGVQLYTGNNLNGKAVGKNGTRYEKWSGLCLETQFYPNAMKNKHFPSPILRAGDSYHYITIYKFV